MDNPADEFQSWNKNLNKCYKSSDFVTYVAPYLDKVINKDKKLYVKNGVNFSRFNDFKPVSKPEQLKNISLPILGYYGAHATWYDFEIVRKIADLKKIHIVSIGGIPNHIFNKKIDHENITWISHMKQEKLLEFLYFFDFCIIPFKLTEMMKGCDPLKYYEYLAAGKIVLTTEIEAILGNDFTFYINHENYKSIIQKCLQLSHSEKQKLIDKGIDFAKQNDWLEISKKIKNHINK